MFEVRNKTFFLSCKARAADFRPFWSKIFALHKNEDFNHLKGYDVSFTHEKF